jgi:GNAT superfamily N-acetyltransferase
MNLTRQDARNLVEFARGDMSLRLMRTIDPFTGWKAPARSQGPFHARTAARLVNKARERVPIAWRPVAPHLGIEGVRVPLRQLGDARNLVEFAQGIVRKPRVVKGAFDPAFEVRSKVLSHTATGSRLTYSAFKVPGEAKPRSLDVGRVDTPEAARRKGGAAALVGYLKKVSDRTGLPIRTGQTNAMSAPLFEKAGFRKARSAWDLPLAQRNDPALRAKFSEDSTTHVYDPRPRKLAARLNAMVEFASALRKRITVQPGSSANPAVNTLSLTLGGKTVGKLASHVRYDGKDVINTSWIDPKFRGMGLGKKLYGEALKRSPGGTLLSDSSVSAAAERVYGSMSRSKSYKVKSLPTHAGSLQPRFQVQTKAPSPPARTPEGLARISAGSASYHERRDRVLKKWDDRRWRLSAAKAQAVRGSGVQI